MYEDTLRIKNLPKELSDGEKEEFLRHFGAIHVKLITSLSKNKSVAYAKFENKDIARAVLQRLHQVIVLNSRLCVEFADNDIGQTKPELKKLEESDATNKKYFKNFIIKLNSLNSNMGFHQPPPPHLKYAYPKANRPTVNNIAHALLTIPKFYTQVLHLMNRMNLPPPFALPQPQTTTPQPQIQPQPVEHKSTSESELESDEDGNKREEVIPQKRKLPQKKTVKRPKFIKPQVATPNPNKQTEKCDVFERVDVQVQKKIELKVSGESLEKVHDVEPVGKIDNAVGEEIEGKMEEKSDVISEEELKTNQIPLKDLGVLPVFKNYHAGAPTCRLYVKNIAKAVDVKDLEYIYNRYRVELKDGSQSSFDIRLMQEGRMKGQAFITFDSVELAQKALNETNGYILKDKPLVVVFARSVVQKNS